jgi:hypothetical protein
MLPKKQKASDNEVPSWLVFLESAAVLMATMMMVRCHAAGSSIRGSDGRVLMGRAPSNHCKRADMMARFFGPQFFTSVPVLLYAIFDEQNKAPQKTPSTKTRPKVNEVARVVLCWTILHHTIAATKQRQ